MGGTVDYYWSTRIIGKIFCQHLLQPWYHIIAAYVVGRYRVSIALDRLLRVWGSRLKMLRNKWYSSFRLLKLVFPPRSPTLNLTYFPDYVRNPDERPMSVYNATFLVLEWRAIIVLLSSLFLSGWILHVLEREKIPFFLFTGKTARTEPATSQFIISHPLCDAIVRK